MLVGADGAGSRVRRQYLPDAGRETTGAVGIGHKVYLDEADRAWVPDVMTRGMTLTSAPEGMLFTAVFRPRPGTEERLRELGVDDVPEMRPYILAALVVEPRRLAADPAELAESPDPDALPRAVDRLVAGWHPTLRRLFAASDPEARNVGVFRAATPTPPWTPSRVTLLGDAIHQMPPVGGMGGNTALRDAALLTRLLPGAADPVAAIGEYEAEMRTYAYPVVASAVAGQDSTMRPGRARLTAMRGFFRLCRRVPAVRRLTVGRGGWGPPPRPWEQEDVAS